MADMRKNVVSTTTMLLRLEETQTNTRTHTLQSRLVTAVIFFDFAFEKKEQAAKRGRWIADWLREFSSGESY